MAKKVSLKDIANKVGVSTALVSYALGGQGKENRVSKKYLEKIRQAAEEMNYQPNMIARSLRKGNTNTIGLIVADISNSFFAHLARMIEDEASKFNYTVIIGSSDGDALKSATLINTFLNRQVDGFIIVPPEGGSDQIKSLVKNDIPLVLIDRYLNEISTNYVVLDNYRATYSAVQYFISKGYRNIKLVAYKSLMTHMKERIRGYVEAMKENGMAKDILVNEVRFKFEKNDMEKIIEECRNEKGRKAILFVTNTLSIFGLYTMMEKKIKIPEEMAVICFDRHEAFDFYNPPITHVEQPIEEMGKEAIKILLGQISDNKRIVRIELKHKLIEKSSC